MIPFKAKYRRSFCRTTTYEFEIPTDYSELTLGQYVDVLKWDGKNLIDLVGILTGLPEEVTDNTNEHQVGAEVAKHLQWVTVAPVFMIGKEADGYEALAFPESVEIKGKSFDVPQDLTLETFGQKISLQMHLKKSEKDKLTLVECIPMALAIYFYPVITGNLYDEDEAKEIIPLIKEMNFKDAYSIASSFFDQFEKIVDTEIAQIPNKNDSKQSLAGIEKLQPFGVFGTIDALANGDMLKYDEVLLQRYCDIFVKLKYDYEKSEFQERYAELLRRENK